METATKVVEIEAIEILKSYRCYRIDNEAMNDALEAGNFDIIKEALEWHGCCQVQKCPRNQLQQEFCNTEFPMTLQFSVQDKFKDETLRWLKYYCSTWTDGRHRERHMASTKRVT